jgi:adenine deaminase
MALAANRLVENHGGIVVVENGQILAELSLEIAGLMTDRPLEEVNTLLENAKAAAYGLGIRKDVDPFMTLSFMSLPVIPSLRLTTRGVIDVVTQQYV